MGVQGGSRGFKCQDSEWEKGFFSSLISYELGGIGIKNNNFFNALLRGANCYRFVNIAIIEFS